MEKILYVPMLYRMLLFYFDPVNVIQPIILNFRFFVPMIVAILIEVTLFQFFAHIKRSDFYIVLNFSHTFLAAFNIAVVKVIPGI